MERGKPRTIRPVEFRDRVVQRCLCDLALAPAIEGYVSPDCSACLKGRGLGYAYERVRAYAEACPYEGWVFQADFRDYFHTIGERPLAALVAGLLPDPRFQALAMLTVTTGAGGLELGSHVSQLLACAYATPFDRAVASVPGVVGAHRYMDDTIALCAGRESAILVRERAFVASEGLGLSLNRGKTHVNRIGCPFVFCKMRFTKEPDGSVRKNVRKQQSRRSVRHARSVARLAGRRPDLGIGLEPVRAAIAGYLARGDADLSCLVGRAFG